MNVEKLLEATNAKHSDASELIETFVPSAHFTQTLVKGHSILLGPRGSGKTTILRMLSNEVLPNWKHSEAENYRNSISFEGIYVRGDRVWGEMIKSLEHSNVQKDTRKALAVAAFNSHVFSATIGAMERALLLHSKRAEKKVVPNKSEMASCLKEIADTLYLSDAGLSFDSLSFALERRVIEINAICYELTFYKSDDDIENLRRYPYLAINLPLTLDLILDRFDKCLKRPSHKWALLLDEFEIAPLELQRQVLSDLRSANKKYIYKVALIPCGAFVTHKKRGEIQSTKNNDYSIIELWHKSKNDLNKFCVDFMEKKYKRHPREVFGETKFATKDQSGKWSEKWLDEFLELKNKDKSFENFLIEKKILLNELDDDGPNRDRLRKIAPLVAFRNALRAESDEIDSGPKRSRKKLPDFYTGWQAITAISEGNPRWLTIMLNSLLSEETESILEFNMQYDKVLKTSKAFLAMIKTAALTNNMGVSTKTPPVSIICRIQEGIIKRLINDSFKEDLPLSFTVGENTEEDVINSLRIALNYGAIVCTSDSDDIDDYQELKGKDFRVSYLLAPVLQLPLKSDRSVSLATLMAKEQNAKSVTSISQRGLFE